MRRIRYGMVGGGSDAFIGAVHRMAARLDDGWAFCAGALSSTPEKARSSGAALGLDPSRAYGSWQEMLEGEAGLGVDERIEAVVVVTPNDMHFPVAHAAVEAGLHVVCDKPMVMNSGEAERLARAVEAAGTVFAVTYNYSGYPLVKQARHLVSIGTLDRVRRVVVEYNQGWLATKLESSGQKQAGWRTDPARAGLGGAIGDIGSHAEQLASYVTGLGISAICADLTSHVDGRSLDDDANVLLRFDNGARGILTATQIAVGEENGLSIRVYGEAGGLEWRQEEPNRLRLTRLNGPETVFTRNGPGLCDEALAACRIPPGHPEAFIEAFANVYAGARAEILRRGGGAPDGAPASALDYPGLADGARGVRFIEKAVESAASDRKWTEL